MSNPPYIDAADPYLTEGDVRFEPASALIAPEQGLADIRHIISQSVYYLAVGGRLMLEHGYQQAKAVRALLAAHGFTEVGSLYDDEGHERVTYGLSY